MSFYYLYALVFAQRPDILLYVSSQFSIDRFSSVLGRKHNVVLTHPLGMRQTVCLVCHTFHFSFCNRPEHPYCSRKVSFLYNFLPSTRIAGGFLFRFAQLPKGTNKKQQALAGLLFQHFFGVKRRITPSFSSLLLPQMWSAAGGVLQHIFSDSLLLLLTIFVQWFFYLRENVFVSIHITGTIEPPFAYVILDLNQISPVVFSPKVHI